jgi:hypothetical protein
MLEPEEKIATPVLCSFAATPVDPSSGVHRGGDKFLLEVTPPAKGFLR